MAKSDFAGLCVELVHNGKGLKVDSLAANEVAAGLKSLFNGNAYSLDGCSGGGHEVDKSVERGAVGKKVVDDKNVVVGAEVFFADKNVVNAFFGEGFDLGAVNLAVNVEAFGFFRKDNGNVSEIGGNNACNADALSFNGQNFVYVYAFKKTFPLFSHLLKKRNVHLVIKKTIHLQDITGTYRSVF